MSSLKPISRIYRQSAEEFVDRLLIRTDVTKSTLRETLVTVFLAGSCFASQNISGAVKGLSDEVHKVEVDDLPGKTSMEAELTPDSDRLRRMS